MIYSPSFSRLGQNPARTKVNDELVDMIEHLRFELMKAVEHDNFSSDVVLELSQKLDQYIVMAQTQMLGRQVKNKNKNKKH